MLNQLLGRRLQLSRSHSAIFCPKELTDQAQGDLIGAEVTQQECKLCLDFGLVPIISAAITQAVDSITPDFVFFTVIIRLPLRRLLQHGSVQSLSHLRLAPPFSE